MLRTLRSGPLPGYKKFSVGCLCTLSATLTLLALEHTASIFGLSLSSGLSLVSTPSPCFPNLAYEHHIIIFASSLKYPLPTNIAGFFFSRDHGFWLVLEQHHSIIWGILCHCSESTHRKSNWILNLFTITFIYFMMILINKNIAYTNTLKGSTNYRPFTCFEFF